MSFLFFSSNEETVSPVHVASKTTIKEANGHIQALFSKVNDLESERDDFLEQIRLKDAEILSFKKSIVDFQEVVTNRDIQIKNLELTVTEQEEIIDQIQNKALEYKVSVVAKEEVVQNLSSTLEEKDSALSVTSYEVEGLSATIEDLKTKCLTLEGCQEKCLSLQANLCGYQEKCLSLQAELSVSEKKQQDLIEQLGWTKNEADQHFAILKNIMGYATTVESLLHVLKETSSLPALNCDVEEPECAILDALPVEFSLDVSNVPQSPGEFFVPEPSSVLKVVPIEASGLLIETSDLLIETENQLEDFSLKLEPVNASDCVPQSTPVEGAEAEQYAAQSTAPLEPPLTEEPTTKTDQILVRSEAVDAIDCRTVEGADNSDLEELLLHEEPSNDPQNHLQSEPVICVESGVQSAPVRENEGHDSEQFAASEISEPEEFPLPEEPSTELQQIPTQFESDALDYVALSEPEEGAKVENTQKPATVLLHELSLVDAAEEPSTEVPEIPIQSEPAIAAESVVQSTPVDGAEVEDGKTSEISSHEEPSIEREKMPSQSELVDALDSVAQSEPAEGAKAENVQQSGTVQLPEALSPEESKESQKPIEAAHVVVDEAERSISDEPTIKAAEFPLQSEPTIAVQSTPVEGSEVDDAASESKKPMETVETAHIIVAAAEGNISDLPKFTENMDEVSENISSHGSDGKESIEIHSSLNPENVPNNVLEKDLKTPIEELVVEAVFSEGTDDQSEKCIGDDSTSITELPDATPNKSFPVSAEVPVPDVDLVLAKQIAEQMTQSQISLISLPLLETPPTTPETDVGQSDAASDAALVAKESSPDTPNASVVDVSQVASEFFV